MHIRITGTELHWLNVANNSVLMNQQISRIRVWGVGQENERYFNQMLHACNRRLQVTVVVHVATKLFSFKGIVFLMYFDTMVYSLRVFFFKFRLRFRIKQKSSPTVTLGSPFCVQSVCHCVIKDVTKQIKK